MTLLTLKGRMLRMQTCLHRLLLKYWDIFDIRFKDRDQEKAYKADLEIEVVRNSMVVVFAAVMIIVISIAGKYNDELTRTDGKRWTCALGDVRTTVFFCWLYTAALGLAYMSVGFARIQHNWFRWVNWESLFMFVITTNGVCLAVANFWHMPLIVGQNPEKVWERDPKGTDVLILLAIDGLMTMSTMYVPVRFCMTWSLPLFSVGSYFVETITLPSMFPYQRHITIGALLALTYFAYNGRLRGERTHREKWLALQMVVEAEETMKEQERTIEETAALVRGWRTVADALCDITVKLTSDLVVMGSEMQHDAFFQRSLEGQSFTVVLTERDQSRFASLVADCSSQQIPACMPSTICKKSMTSEVHLLLVDTGRREPRYLLGIRVEADHFRESSAGTEVNFSDINPGFHSILPRTFGKLDEKADNEHGMDDSDFSFQTYPKHEPPPVPFFTPVKARALSLKKLLPRWHVPRDIDSCCQLHTVITSIEEVSQYLMERPCEPLWSTWSGGQCLRCKCMCNNAKRRCVVCGYEPEDCEKEVVE